MSREFLLTAIEVVLWVGVFLDPLLLLALLWLRKRGNVGPERKKDPTGKP